MRRRLYAVALGACAVAFVGPALATDTPYSLTAGDVLQITVWKEDGMDREVVVLPDDTISFPLVGTLTVRNKSTEDVRKEIVARLTPYVRDAVVTVAVKSPLGNAFNVIGQVNKPGELVVGRRTTVMQALSMAGGVTPYASHSAIIILRRSEAGEIAIPFPYDEVIRGRSLEHDIVLTPGDVVVVPAASLF
jgi:polysaccharide export outer membrane protein